MQGILALIQSRNIPQEPYSIQQHVAGKKQNAKSKSNGVAEQEKGVNVVQFQDGIAQALQRPHGSGIRI
jgi:hypothetical protein